MSEDFLSKYQIIKEIGSGGFSTVYLGRDKTTNQQVAIKIISKSSNSDLSEVKKEMIIQRTFDSPYIVNIYDMKERKDDFVLVMEYVNGGELFDAIVNNGPFSENEAAKLVQQILIGLKLLHDNNVIHRDLKPENLLLQVEDNGKSIVKIADFGLAGLIDNHADMSKFCGTEGYAAPEIIQNFKYDQSADMWSLGVIVFIILSGCKPFDSDDSLELFEQVVSADYEFFSPEFDDISNEAKNFIAACLQLDPKRRLTVDQALKSPWITGHAPVLKLDSLSKQLRLFNTKRKMRRVIISQLYKVRLAKLITE